jgi:hypothetical protein
MLLGRSKLNTYGILGKSNPREATSVAIRIGTSPFEKLLIAF